MKRLILFALLAIPTVILAQKPVDITITFHNHDSIFSECKVSTFQLPITKNKPTDFKMKISIEEFISNYTNIGKPNTNQTKFLYFIEECRNKGLTPKLWKGRRNYYIVGEKK